MLPFAALFFDSYGVVVLLSVSTCLESMEQLSYRNSLLSLTKSTKPILVLCRDDFVAVMSH